MIMDNTTKRKIAEDYVKRHPDIATEIFRCVQREYIRNDAEQVFEGGIYNEYLDFDENGELTEESETLIDDICENVAERYAFDREYDCNQSHNNNIESLIKSELCMAGIEKKITA